MRNLRLALVLITVAASGAAVPRAEAAADFAAARDAAAQPAATGAPQAILGFQMGIERRYVLGPPDALVDGESAEWRITLHHIEGEGDAARGVFDLDYTRSEPYGPLREPRVTRSVWGELTVNPRGFPLRLVVGQRVESGEIITEYTYGEGRYEMTIRWPETEMSTTLRIPGHGKDDELVGVYAFLTRIADQRVNGGRAFNDTILANPGLLSLAMPMPLPPDDWDDGITFFTPNWLTIRHPTPDWLRLQRSPQVLNTYFDRNKIELRGTEEIDIGGETVLARRFDIEGPFRGGYVDALGRILLLRHDPGRGMERPQHIRMLRPSEY